MKQKLFRLFEEKIIRHFRESHSTLHELSLGSLVGFFWALTPLIGIQMTLATITWGFMRLLGFRFNLPVALAVVWLSNPITMPILYYSFYLCGYHLFSAMGIHSTPISFEILSQTLNQAQALSLSEGLLLWGKFLLLDLGWPMLIGSFLIGVPVSIVSYPITWRMVKKHRIKVAERMNLTLREWEEKFVHK